MTDLWWTRLPSGAPAEGQSRPMTFGEPISRCAICSVELPGVMLAEHIKLLHLPNDLGFSWDIDRKERR